MSTPRIEDLGTQPRQHQCSVCVHLDRSRRQTCVAFPAGIPREILTEVHDHRRSFPGDHAITFAALPGKRHPLDVVSGPADV